MRGVRPFLDLVSPARAEEPSSAGAAQLIAGMRGHAGDLVQRLGAIREALADLPGYAQHALDLLTDLEGLPSLGAALLALIAVAALGGIAQWLFSRTMRRLRERMAATPGTLMHAGALLASLLLDAIGIIIFLAVANGATFLFLDRFDPRRELVVAILLAISAAQLAGAVSRAILSPSTPRLRLISLDDLTARGLQRWAVGLAAIAGFAYFGGGLLGILAVPPELRTLWDIAFALLLALLLAAWIWLNRRSVADAFGSEGFAQSWHAAATVYVAMVWLVWSYKRLLDRPDGTRTVLLSALVVLAVPLADRLVRRLLDRLFRPWPGQEAETALRLARASRVILGAFRVMIAVAAIAILIEAWGGPVIATLRNDMGRSILRAVFNIAVAVVLGYGAWEGSKILIERHVGRPQPGEELQPGTRAHTLLPVLRHFALGALSVVIGLIVLSSLGVDIAPLLAGAGIVGLAIGFGAQALVRDIVAGFFFLLDDAFRIGEYVDVGRVKGTVEGITIRSLQLRHHRGALHTIPYGQIQAISNHHRDWVIEKLEFGLAYGTDIEKVRKILKKIGQELAENPEIATVMLEPLKSQGVMRLTETAMIFRAKFKTKPGEQFLVRREAYQRMQAAFAANGIEFAFPTVRIAENASDGDIAAAAHRTIAANAPKPPEKPAASGI